MILTGSKLEEIGKAVWGEDWLAVVSKRLQRARKTLRRYKDEDRPIPPDFREDFARLVDDQLVIVAAYHGELRQNGEEVF